MLSKHELTQRILDALPDSTAAEVNRRIRLEPWLMRACTDLPVLEALLQRPGIDACSAWRPAAMALAALGAGEAEALRDPLAWLAESRQGRARLQSAYQAFAAGPQSAEDQAADDAHPARDLVRYGVTAVALQQRLKKTGDTLSDIRQLARQDLSCHGRNAVICLYGLLDNPRELAATLLASPERDDVRFAMHMLLLNETPADMAGILEELAHDLPVGTQLTIAGALDEFGAGCVSKGLASAAEVVSIHEAQARPGDGSADFTAQVQWVAEAAQVGMLASAFDSHAAFELLANAVQASERLAARLALQLGRTALAQDDAVSAVAAFEQALRLSTQEHEVLPLLAEAYVALGRPREALQFIPERDLGSHSLQYSAHVDLVRSRIELELGNVQAAREIVSGTISRLADDSPARRGLIDRNVLLGLADVAERMDDFWGAAQALTILAEAFPAGAETQRRLVRVLERGGQITEARAAALELVALAPGDADANARLAETLMSAGTTAVPDPPAALRYWQKAVEVEPDGLRYLFGLSQCALAAGQAKLARKTAERALRLAAPGAEKNGQPAAAAPEVGKAHIVLAQALAALDDKAAAFEHFQQATALNPTSCEAWQAVAAYHRDQGKLEQALAALEAGRQAVGESDAGAAATLLADLAELQIQAGRPTEATANLREAVRLQPTNPDLQRRHGHSLIAQGRAAEGATALREAATLRPTDARLWHELGQALEKVSKNEDALGAYQRAQSAGAAGFELAHDLGSLAFRMGRNDIARPALEEAAKSELADAATLTLLGSLYESLNLHDRAMPIYQRAIGLAPARGDLVVRLGVCCLAVGNAPAAIAALKTAAEHDLDDLALQRTIGEAYLQERLWDEAILAFQQAVRLAPDDARLWQRLAQAARGAGNLARAVEALHQATRLSPGRAKLLTELGQLCAEGELWPEARDAFDQSLKLDPEQPTALVGLGQCLMRLDQAEAGIALLDRASSIAPDDLQVLEALGSAYSGAGRLDAAHRVFLHAADVCEEQNYPAQHRAAYLRRAADALWSLGRAAPAIALWQRALRHTPDDAGLLTQLGQALTQEGRGAEALEAFEHAVAADPSDESRFLSAARAAQDTGDAERAVVHYRRALELVPANAETHYALGRALLTLDKAQAALEALQQAEELRPGTARYAVGVGCALACLGDLPAALAQCDAALEADADDPRVWADAGDIFVQAGQYARGVDALARVADQQPDDPHAQMALAGALTLSLEVDGATGQRSGHEAVSTRLNQTLERAEELGADAVLVGELKGRAQAVVGEPAQAIQLLQRAAAERPSAEVYTSLALALRRADDLPGARQAIQLALDRAPGNVRALVEFGRIAFRQREDNLALQALKRAVSIDPGHAAARFALGEALWAGGSRERAREEMLRAAQLAPAHAAWQQRVADFYRESGERSAALAHQQRAVYLAREQELPPRTLAAYTATLAQLYADDGDAHAARREYEAALALVDDNAAWWTAAGHACLSIGEPAPAANHFDRAAELAPRALAPLVGAAQAYIALRRADQAEARATAALKLDPDNSAALLALGDLCALREDYSNAIVAYNQATERALDPLPIRLAQARLLIRLGRRDDALAVLEQALELDGESQDAWALVGETHLLSHDTEAALEAFRKACDAAPLEARFHLRLGQICRSAGHLDQALAHLNRAVELQHTPDEGARAHFEIGQIFEARRQFDRAYESYLAAATRQPDAPEYPFRAGMVLKQLRDYAEAAAMFERAVGMDSRNLEARRQLAAVAALRLINEGAMVG